MYFYFVAGHPKILVIALHKLGDNLQVTPVFRVLKERHPGSHVAVLTEDRFAFPFRGNPFIDEIALFDRGRYTGGAVRDAVQLAREACPELQRLRNEHFDLVLNRHSSLEGGAMAWYLAPAEIRGLYLRDDGRTGINDPWTRLLFAACQCRHHNPFNFVDYGLNAAGAAPEGPRRLEIFPGKDGRAAELLHSVNPDGGPLLAFQPGSNSPLRQWGAEGFAVAALLLLRLLPDLKILFIGSPSEGPLVRRILEAQPPVPRERMIDLTERLPLPLLPGVLAACRLLITNDTGPMHMAAAVDCPVLALYFGESFVNETGPYGPGHTVLHAALECLPCVAVDRCDRGVACQKTLRPAAVAELVRSRLTGRAPDPAGLAGTEAHFSGTDPLTREIRFLPLIPRPVTDDDLLRRLHYALFRSALHGIPFETEPVAADLAAGYTGVRERLARDVRFDLSLIQKYTSDSGEQQRLTEALKNGFLALRERLSS